MIIRCAGYTFWFAGEEERAVVSLCEQAGAELQFVRLVGGCWMGTHFGCY